MSTPLDSRLFPDFAAVPTPAERRGARRYWQAAQTGLDLFAAPADPNACPVCAGDHAGPCTLGTAPELFA